MWTRTHNVEMKNVFLLHETPLLHIHMWPLWLQVILLYRTWAVIFFSTGESEVLLDEYSKHIFLWVLTGPTRDVEKKHDLLFYSLIYDLIVFLLHFWNFELYWMPVECWTDLIHGNLWRDEIQKFEWMVW